MCKNLIRLTALGLLLIVAAGVANAGIIAYWPIEEGTGDIVTDVVGQVQARMTGIDWVAGKVGNSAVESTRGTDSIVITPGIMTKYGSAA